MNSHLARIFAVAGICATVGPLAFSQTTASPKLEGVVVVEKGYTMDVISQSMRYEYAQWTLFQDGTAFSAIPGVALIDFDVKESRKREPKRWGRWKISGEALEVSWGDSPTKKQYKKWFRLTPLADGARLSAAYTAAGVASSSGLFESAFFTGWKDLIFRPDGTFEQRIGGSASLSGGYGDVLSAKSNVRRGIYVVEGATLTFRFDDGKTSRASVFLSDKEGATLFLNGVRLRRRARL